MKTVAKNILQKNEEFLPNSEFNCLKFITCGSVDAGKSTLIGRFLFDSQLLYEDQINVLQRDTKKYSTFKGKENLDFSLLLDGLQDEREQGITIDLSYRFFDISGKRFIVADAPGHEQYTKNMAAGASNSTLGIILLDAKKGILQQTKRHTYILYLMGIRHFVICINKMDLINFSENIFNELCIDFEKLIMSFEKNNKTTLYFIPVSASQGDNVSYKSASMGWYKGKSLFSYLEDVKLDVEKANGFIMPVQSVSRSIPLARCYMGSVLEGKINVGDKIKVLPSQRETTIKKIITFDEENKKYAVQGEAVTLLLDDEVDIVRGDIIVNKDCPIKIADQFRVNLFCIDNEPLYLSRTYTFKFAHKILNGVLSNFKRSHDLEFLNQNVVDSLNLNEFGICDVFLNQKIPFKAYEDNKSLGSFLIIDRISKKTIGIGMILFDLRRSHNILPGKLKITKNLRSQIKDQKPCALWFTGLSSSGKTTIANIVEEKLFDKGYHTYLIDGDNIRQGLNFDLGFTKGDRIENIRRIGHLSKYFVDAGLVTLIATISPFRNERENIRDFFEPQEFIEIYVKASLKTCIQRDPKKIYAKQKLGEVPNLTGINSIYEQPLHPELIVDTESASAETLADKIVDYFIKIQI